MRANLTKLALTALSGTFFFLLVTGGVLAIGPNSPRNINAVDPTIKPTPSGLPGKRLGEQKLRSCEAKQKAIKTRSESLIRFAMNMEDKFDSIAKRVEGYYNSKVVPGGKTVPNYNVLVADIATKKDMVTTKLNKAQADISGFSCIGDNPKELLLQFNQDMKDVKAALKDYRTSVRNLIVAVKSLTGETNKAEKSPKPSPSPKNK